MGTYLRIFVALLIAIPVSQAATIWTNSFANVTVRTNLTAAGEAVTTNNFTKRTLLTVTSNALDSAVAAKMDNTRAAVTNAIGVSIDGSGNIVTPGSITSLAPGPTVVTNLVMATNTPSRVQFTDSTGSVQSVTHTGIVLGTGAQYPSGSYTVAGLPAAASYPGAVLYCSDMLTPNGIGGTVFSDGTNWRSTITRIVATADLRTFMLGSTAVQWLGRGPLMYTLQGEFVVATSGTVKFTDFDAIFSGTVSPATDYGWDGAVFSTSTSATAYGGIMAGYYLPTNSDWIVMSVTMRLRNNLSTDAEQYWSQFGASPAVSSYGTSHSGFLYDPHNINGHGITGPSTNNWLVFDQAAGVLTNIIDTGVVATTNFTTFTRVVNGTNSWGYINGTVVYTNNAGPVVATFPFVAKISKAVGTTARQLDIKNAYMATRRGTAESTYP